MLSFVSAGFRQLKFVVMRHVGWVMKIGDRVKHKHFKWLKTTGTVVDIEEYLPSPFVTANVPIPGKVKVKWDVWENCDYEDEGMCRQEELEVVA
jgi:hypothetical protein